MGLSSAMEIGKRGLIIYQVATEVTGENIANVNTEGYSRQRVILETSPPTTHNGFPLGTGVKISTVERYYDSLLQQQLVTANSASGYDTLCSEVLQQIEPSFNELTNDGIGSAITNYFQAWEDLSTNASGTTERQVLLSQAQVLVESFNSVSTTLTDTIKAQDSSLTALTADINNKLTNIATLNAQIKQTELVSGNANEMRDQRDLLVKQLAEQMGIKYTENADGTTDVYVQDSTPATYYLVQGNQAGSLTVGGTSPARTVTIDSVSGATKTVDSTLYTAQDGGTLWATLQLRDVIIPDYIDQLDDLASTIITDVNTQHQAGFDINGDPGADFFSGTSAATFSVSITDPNNIAAAGSSAAAPGGNGNALLIADLQSGFSISYNTLVSQIGLDVDQAETVVEQDEAYLKQLNTLRDSKSGVSLDEELTNLVMYQRSYQASAKLITTVTEMMDTLLAMV
ncbi:flagellar hook-associated protein FlgK [Pelobacter propionicus]|uniref:Flagellar hook-associated protein 1 n=1 Tax=Pelobacter propionicus (strain DSM 2379 / NBRC 103807 / OttBd1) TaxID=338966 RepID=A1AUM7_PELPD|nr:flagellar hook-associated protein FlgK [Pelobacter propionicus]ABL01048.1 flagellar hook-associated protein FlgK [Pelobacter propionicus DSM 2379]